MTFGFVFQFVIVGTFGETALTDIAVDAVCVMVCEGESIVNFVFVSTGKKRSTSCALCFPYCFLLL